ncbi:Leukocyte surface antigen cd53, partial [Nowakowskiella sp. JEL0407]
LAGIILISGGGYLQSNTTSEDVINLSSPIAIAAIVIGLIITLVSFLGCFGAANEKGLLLKSYFVLLIVLIILEISVGIAAYVKKEEIPTLLEKGWTTSYRTSPKGIFVVEKMFECCGFHNTTHLAIPPDCPDQYPTWTQSCFEVVTLSLQNSLNTIGGAGIILGVFELAGLIFSLVLFQRIAKRDQQKNGLLNESWRINKSRIHYGYQNYQYA